MSSILKTIKLVPLLATLTAFSSTVSAEEAAQGGVLWYQLRRDGCYQGRRGPAEEIISHRAANRRFTVSETLDPSGTTVNAVTITALHSMPGSIQPLESVSSYYRLEGPCHQAFMRLIAADSARREAEEARLRQGTERYR
jgi:hypothetical protein